MRTILEEKDYAKICLNCPHTECRQDGWGECDRTRPYRTDVKNEYARQEKKNEK